METRRRLEDNEAALLAPCACRSGESRGRIHGTGEHPHRTAFQRDRDRIVHSTAFRRLEYKTQVFVFHEGDHYRNRLTHSLEVAQIGRTLARMLRLNEDLVEAVALAHDLGHPPFGHSGERVLDRLMAGAGGFEHNRQSLRVVEVIEHRYKGHRGLDLTWEVREGLAKHLSEYDAATGGGDYPPGPFPSLEAQIVCIADEIAYTSHDLDDGLSSGIIDPGDLLGLSLLEAAGRPAAAVSVGEDRLAQAHTLRGFIDLLVQEIYGTARRRIEERGIDSPDGARTAAEPVVGLGRETGERFAEVKALLRERMYRHYRVLRMGVKAERILTELFSLYAGDQDLLPPSLKAHLGEVAMERLVCDYIAGMTDRYAIQEYQKFFDPWEKV